MHGNFHEKSSESQSRKPKFGVTADLTDKIHDQDMGRDIECLLTWNEKVNSFENYFYIL